MSQLISAAVRRLRSDLASTAAGKGDALVAIQRAAAGAVATTEHTWNERQEFNLASDFDMTAANTRAEVKAALQLAIAAAAAMGGGVVHVPGWLDYGYVDSNIATHPDFTGINVPVMVMDYSRGASFAGFPAAYDGMQQRVFTHTPQTTSPGQHNGNTQWLRAYWAPAYTISNDSNLGAPNSAGRTATDNRRAFYSVANDGLVTWQWGQGTQVGAGLTDPQMSAMVIDCFGANHGGARGTFTWVVAQMDTGHTSFGGQTNSPPAAWHFKELSAAGLAHMIEGLGTTVFCAVRNSEGAASDCYVKNSFGSLQLAVAAGLAMTVSKTTRAVSVELPFRLPVHSRAGLPNAATFIEHIIIVNDAIGGRCVAVSNGANWVSMINGANV